MLPHRLHVRLDDSVARWPDRPAIEDAAGQILTYRQLDEARRRLSRQLRERGVTDGDRVGLCLPKSLQAVAAIHGILHSGAAYVPLDVTVPLERNAWILADCRVEVVIVTAELAAPLRSALQASGGSPQMLVIEMDPQIVDPEELFEGPLEWRARQGAAMAAEDSAPAKVEDLAYILYTSGSTGRPKGVILTHRNADAFLSWCSHAFEPRPGDRFASHAPLYFDLSILDLHLPMRHGACVVLIDDATGKDPRRLAPFIAERALTCWYSAPSTLALLAQLGKLEDHDLSSLRWVLFAGEVFPLKHLRSLVEQLPGPRYVNLYGPTETNVCTYFEIPRPIDPQRHDPFPIGSPCDPFEALLLDDRGQAVDGPGQGELLVRGPGVTRGYWNLSEMTAKVFWNTTENVDPWYRTGDLVRRDDSGLLHFLGRRDRMVKRRGYRIELDEIEACLYRHPDIEEAAVVAHHHDDGVRIDALLCGDGGGAPSGLELRRFVHRHLPGYMCPDRFHTVDFLPRTATGKMDYQQLQRKV